MELIGIKVRANVGLYLGGARQRDFVDLQQIVKRHGVFGGVKVADVGEQKLQRVANASVGVYHAGQDFVVDIQVARVVGAGHPQAHDFGAHFVAHLLRRDGVAQALAHLAALAVSGKAVGQQAFVGRAVVQGAAQQQRAVEPAAVLVVAFEVQVSFGR